MRTRNVLVAIAAIVTLLVGGAAGAELIARSSRSRSAEIEVVVNGAVVASTTDAGMALEGASRQVGFAVVVPRRLPYAGFRLAGIRVELGRPSEPDAPSAATVVVADKPGGVTAGATVIEIRQPGRPPCEPADCATLLDLGVPGARAYVQETDLAAGYWLFANNRGFEIAVRGPAPPARGEMFALLKSLANEAAAAS
ncbi:MAG: hypothetical protein HY875_14985 [Chloroflexi bacterium]|nr:hypothetical protein [Chloroflexota bacterium]